MHTYFQQPCDALWTGRIGKLDEDTRHVDLAVLLWKSRVQREMHSWSRMSQTWYNNQNSPTKADVQWESQPATWRYLRNNRSAPRNRTLIYSTPKPLWYQSSNFPHSIRPRESHHGSYTCMFWVPSPPHHAATLPCTWCPPVDITKRPRLYSWNQVSAVHLTWNSQADWCCFSSGKRLMYASMLGRGLRRWVNLLLVLAWLSGMLWNVVHVRYDACGLVGWWEDG